MAERKIVAQLVAGKCLVIESFSETLPDGVLERIMEDVEAKKEHKFAMLDQFVNLLDGYTDSEVDP